MFAAHVSQVQSATHVVRPRDSSSDGFLCLVVRKQVVPLVDLGVWDGRCVDNSFIVPEHHGGSFDGYPKVSQCDP